MKKKYCLVAIIVVILIVLSVIMIIGKKGIVVNKESEDNMRETEFVSKVNITINGVNYTATLEDNETSRKLVERLPLEVNMNELNGNEKYYYFESNLPTDSKEVETINSGDIMLYGRDCLVLFYETFNTSYSYTRIGKIDDPSTLKETVGTKNIRVSITK